MYLLTLKVTTYCLKLKTHVIQKSTGDNVKMIIVNCSNIQYVKYLPVFRHEIVVFVP